MPSLLKPSEIVSLLSEHVIGQDAAKRTLAVAIHTHFRRMASNAAIKGAPVRLRDDRHIDTTHILFICGGAFVGLDNILTKTHTFGFISTDRGDDQQILERLNARIKPTDLLEFGLIPEFAGRLPIVTRLHELSKDLLIRIMTEPRNAIYRQFQAMLEADGVKLEIAPEAFRQIAELALEYKAGARSLRGIFEEMMTDVLYVIPDDPAIRSVTIRSLFEPPFIDRST